MAAPIDRRRFLYQTAAGLGALSGGVLLSGAESAPPGGAAPAAPAADPGPPRLRVEYPDDRPNVVLVRFGGGVRRRETVQYRDKTYCPFILHELAEKRGVLYKDVMIESRLGIDTSHGQGTLYLLTGRYRHYEDIERQPLSDRFIPQGTTIPEYLRAWYKLAEHETLIVNGEDRVNEEFYTFSNNHLFGVNYRSTVLSLYGFKRHLLREELKGDLPDKERKEKAKKLDEMDRHDYTAAEEKKVPPTPELREERRRSRERIAGFWDGWRDYYGKTGLVNPRGDRLLTTLTLRAMKELRPRFVMINYQDPDYVHWGNPQFYTRAISIIDDGVREIYEASQADEFYRDRTVFVVAPDCGRDNNPGMAVPFQHHFNSRCAHEIFAVVAGPDQYLSGLRGKDDDKNGPKVDTAVRQQTAVAATVAGLMGYKAADAEAPALWDKA